jgi:hypothetical protein
LQFWYYCCSCLALPSSTTRRVTKKSGFRLPMLMTGQVTSPRRPAICQHPSPRVVLARNPNRQQLRLRRGDTSARSAHNRVALHRVVSPRRPTFQTGGSRDHAPLTATGLTITAEMHHPGGEKEEEEAIYRSCPTRHTTDLRVKCTALYYLYR